MKKLFAITLAIAMALSAAACAKLDAPAPGDGSRPKASSNIIENIIPSGEPTEEELEQLQAYASSLRCLNDWTSGETENVYYYDEETGEKRGSVLENGAYYASGVLEYHYNVIQNCPAVDKWAGTQWASDPDINWDRQEVLDSFTVLEDVMLYEISEAMDHLDNQLDKIVAKRYFYNELGQLTDVKVVNYRMAWEIIAPFEGIETTPTQDICGLSWLYEYNENGQWNVMKVLYASDDVRNKVTATYHEDGTLATLTELSDDGNTTTAAYVYDDQQRVAQIQVDGSDSVEYRRTYSYEYDEKGNLTVGKMVRDDINVNGDRKEVVTERYSYTPEGKLESCEHTESVYYHGRIYFETKDVYTYECDDRGRPVKATVVPGDQIDVSTGKVTSYGEAEYAKAEHEIAYGNYYIYNGR